MSDKPMTKTRVNWDNAVKLANDICSGVHAEANRNPAVRGQGEVDFIAACVIAREIGPADLPQLRALYQALTAGDIQWRDVLAEKRDGEAGEETSKLQKALAAQEAKKQKPAPAAQPSAPESDGARFCRLLTAAQDVATLDRIMDDARATLKGADLHSAEQYAIDRRAALGA